jgi:hypothetical protein
VVCLIQWKEALSTLMLFLETYLASSLATALASVDLAHKSL